LGVGDSGVHGHGVPQQKRSVLTVNVEIASHIPNSRPGTNEGPITVVIGPSTQ